MFCIHCGREIADSSNFCSSCGARQRQRTSHKQLTLSATDKKLAGVCGGIAEYLDVDPTIVRLIWVALSVVPGRLCWRRSGLFPRMDHHSKGACVRPDGGRRGRGAAFAESRLNRLRKGSAKAGSSSTDFSLWGLRPCKVLKTHRLKPVLLNPSKLDMKAQRRRKQRAAVAVVAGVVDVLRVERSEDAAPDVQRVVGFDNVLAAVVQFAVAEQEAEASEGQIFLVVARNSVGDEREARAVQLSSPLASPARRRRLAPFRPLRCRRRIRAGLRSIPIARKFPANPSAAARRWRRIRTSWSSEEGAP